MKELSIEQKAKAYDEAIERAKKIHNEHKAQPFDVMLKVFPELAESEDERIRNLIYCLIRDRSDNGKLLEHNGCSVEKALAWLEMQGEKKPDDKVEPRFKVGDTIKPKDGGHEPWQIIQVDILDKKYRFKDGYVIHFSQEDNYELIEQIPTWSEKDRKMLDVIIECIKYLKSREERDKEAGIKLTFIKSYTCIIDWLKSIKERVQPQSKQEWSEEEQQIIEDAASFILSCVNTAETKKEEERLEELADKLQDLRPQNRWKPSDEMLEALYRVIPEHVMEKSEDEILLDKLYQGLKYGRVLSNN